MPEPSVVALEGLPFTGKSSAAAALHRANPSISVIADYHELLTAPERAQMAALSNSLADQHRRVQMYRDMDDLRWKQAHHARGPVVVLDRCFVSIAAYRTALHRSFAATVWNSGENSAEGLECEKPIPDTIVYFALDLDTALARHHRLATTIDERLRGRGFLSNLIDAYNQVLTRCTSTVFVVDSTRDLPTVVRTVEEFFHDTIPN
ncbi:AAA family ATPase [Nocardia sp. XZ_19_369]|uniref:AAA family ATPase n=1 Tax=Nocardia sp. XZ_19_369 TaxID=2769487 RepID=UPI00188E1C79|nr:AAA family ATPase [Nocardia sp. XZ_19_369]